MGGQPAPEGSGDGPVPAGGSGEEVLDLGAFFVLTPGSHGLRGLAAWVGGHPVQGLHDIAGMVAIALGMLVGVTLRRGPAPAGESA
ncbi:hypothetical protein [Streptomyces sp. NPDC049906]|uniref:hypothetical protein n=1 Tax=Streptomyces sp. NPDC049906 TaxID=3155656 RepID=UPI003435948D